MKRTTYGLLTLSLVVNLNVNAQAVLTLTNEINGGSATNADFVLKANDPVLSGQDGSSGVTNVSVTAGAYSLTQTAPSNYDLTFSCENRAVSTEYRFFGDVGLPNTQGFTSSNTGASTIDIIADTVLGVPKNVVRINDDVSNGLVNIDGALTASDWVKINQNGAIFSGISRLDRLNGSGGFFAGLQNDATDKRYGVIFVGAGGYVRILQPDGGTGFPVDLNGSGGFPAITESEWFEWKVDVPPGLGNANVYVNDVLLPTTLPFVTNLGGGGTRIVLSSGSTAGTDRISYHDNFGVTILDTSSVAVPVVAGVVNVGNGDNIVCNFINTYNPPLPVEFAGFQLEKGDGKVLLKWQTASEVNNDYFVVERSLDVVDWESVAIVQGVGDSEQMETYREVDYNPWIGTSYYRIKQVDKDGQIGYSEVRSLSNYESKDYLTVYPNPGQGMLHIQGDKAVLNELEGLTNALGEQVLTSRDFSWEHEGEVVLNLTGIKSGVYLLRTKTKVVKRIVVL